MVLEVLSHNNILLMCFFGRFGGEAGWVFFPVDLVFLATTNLDGVCYTEGGNDIHAKGITAIAGVLKDNGVIAAVNGAKALSDVLKFHGNIKTLMIGWCKIGPKGAEFIADTLKYNNTISTLDLRANGLSDDVNIHDSMKLEYEPPYLEMKELSQALKANEDVRLASLNLASNFLTKLGQVIHHHFSFSLSFP
ncbi:NLR family CARD domain-containing protein 3 isoform X2 [Tanacetum coccineum]